MRNDHLFLIQPGFQRPNRDPKDRFVCPECNIIVGLLASDSPHDRRQLQVTRVPFERPRKAVVDLIGLDNQELPALVLGDDLALPADAKVNSGIYFVNDCARIAELLAERHGFFRL
jgi:hypothetical protein